MKAARVAAFAAALVSPLWWTSPVMAADTEVQVDLSGNGDFSGGNTQLISGITTFDWATFDSALIYSLSSGTWASLYSGIQSSGVVGDTFTFTFDYQTYLLSLTGSGDPTNSTAWINNISTDGGATNQNGDPCNGQCYEIDLHLMGTITATVTEINANDVLFTFSDVSGSFDFLLDGDPITPDNLIDGTAVLSGDLDCLDPSGCGGFRLQSTLEATDSSVLDLAGVNLNTYGDKYITTYPTSGGTILFSTRTQTTAQDPSVECSGANCVFTADANTQFGSATVPEPMSLLLVATGLIGLAATRRPGRKAANAT